MKTSRVKIKYTVNSKNTKIKKIVIKTDKSKEVFNIKKEGSERVVDFLDYLSELFADGYKEYYTKEVHDLRSMIDDCLEDINYVPDESSKTFYNPIGLYSKCINGEQTDKVVMYLKNNGGFTLYNYTVIPVPNLSSFTMSDSKDIRDLLSSTIYIVHGGTEDYTKYKIKVEVVASNEVRHTKEFTLDSNSPEQLLDFLRYMSMLYKNGNKNICVQDFVPFLNIINGGCDKLVLSDKIKKLTEDECLNPLGVLIDNLGLTNKLLKKVFKKLGTGYSVSDIVLGYHQYINTLTIEEIK